MEPGKKRGEGRGGRSFILFSGTSSPPHAKVYANEIQSPFFSLSFLHLHLLPFYFFRQRLKKLRGVSSSDLPRQTSSSSSSLPSLQIDFRRPKEGEAENCLLGYAVVGEKKLSCHNNNSFQKGNERGRERERGPYTFASSSLSLST